MATVNPIINHCNGRVEIVASERDTFAWANRPYRRWPCSRLSGRNVRIEFAPNGDLVDFDSPHDVPACELLAFASDVLAERFPDHPATKHI